MTGQPSYLWPVQGDSKVTNPYGAQQVRTAGFTGPLPSSNVGLDIGAAQGAPLQAIEQGKVVEAGWSDAGWGYTVKVQMADGSTYRMSHMQGQPHVKVGDTVAKGQRVGSVGATGNATGPHVDLEIRDPQGRNIDPTPLLSRSAGMPKTGDGPMADRPEVQTYQRQQRELQTRIATNQERLKGLAAAQRLVDDYKKDKNTPTDAHLQARGLTAQQLAEAQDIVANHDAIRKQIADDEKALRGVEEDLAKAQASAGQPTGPQRTPEQTRIDRANADRLEMELAETRRQQAAQADPNSPESRRLGLQIQQLETQITTARAAAARADAQAPIDLATAQLNLQRAQAQLARETDPLQRRQLELQVQQAEIALRKAQRPDTLTVNGRVYTVSEDGRSATPLEGIGPTIKTMAGPDGRLYYSEDDGRSFRAAEGLPDPEPKDVQAGAGQQYIVRRDAQGNLIQERNPNYREPVLEDPVAQWNAQVPRWQQQANAEKERLLGLQKDGVLNTQEAESQFQSWWKANIEPEMSGLRTMAERQRTQDQFALDKAQREENQRAEGINRQREQYAYESGRQAADSWRKELPHARSAAFVNEYAANVSRMGQGDLSSPGVRFTQEALTAPTPYVAPDAMAAREAARALAHISPAAAATINAPLPELMAPPDVNAYLPKFQLPQASA